MVDRTLQKSSIETRGLRIFLLSLSLLLIFLGLLLGDKEVIKAASHFILWAVGVL